MKKILSILLVAFAAAGCSKAAQTQPTVQVQQKQPAKPSATPAPTQTYKNLTYGFEFQYPASMGFTTPIYAQLEDKVVQLTIPQADYPKTNFGDAAISVSASYAKTLAACLALNPPEGGDGFKTATKFNGLSFFTTKGGGAGAGNDYATRTYRTYTKQQTCIEINETIHTSNIGNYTPGTVTSVNTQTVQDRLDVVLKTFKLE